MMMNLEVLFNFCLMMGVIITISSNNWFSIILGLELTLMSFIPIMSKKFKLNSESCIKYLIIQSLASSTMMMGVIMVSINQNQQFILNMSILLKLGMAPFHTWVMSIVEGMSYYSILMMFTLMKVGPLNLLSYTEMNFNLIVIVGLMIGSMGGLNQNSISKILSYSSVYNMSFLMCSNQDQLIWSIYFMTYVTSLTTFILMVSKLNLNFINQIILNNMSMLEKTILWATLLSMGGLPPMVVFFGKLLIIKFMIINNQYMVLMIMILSSLIVMFYYMRMAFLSLMFYFNMPTWILAYKKKNNSTLMMIMITTPVLLMNIKSF